MALAKLGKKQNSRTLSSPAVRIDMLFRLSNPCHPCRPEALEEFFPFQESPPSDMLSAEDATQVSSVFVTELTLSAVSQMCSALMSPTAPEWPQSTSTPPATVSSITQCNARVCISGPACEGGASLTSLVS